MNDKLIKDLSVFGEGIIKNCIIDSFPKKLWAMWKILTGEAGILLVRINPENLYKKASPK